MNKKPYLNKPGIYNVKILGVFGDRTKNGTPYYNIMFDCGDSILYKKFWIPRSTDSDVSKEIKEKQLNSFSQAARVKDHFTSPEWAENMKNVEMQILVANKEEWYMKEDQPVFLNKMEARFYFNSDTDVKSLSWIKNSHYSLNLSEKEKAAYDKAVSEAKPAPAKAKAAVEEDDDLPF